MGGLTGQANAATSAGGGVSAMDTIVGGMGGARPSAADTTSDMILKPSGVAPLTGNEQREAASRLPTAPQLPISGRGTAMDAVNRAAQALKDVSSPVRLPTAPQLKGDLGPPAETGAAAVDKAQAALAPPASPGTIGSGDTATRQTSSLFEQRVKGTALAGQQPYIDALAQKHNVPPEVAKAIIALETGWGKNVKGNNPAGIMTGGREAMNKVAFSSIEAGLEKSMAVIAKNYQRAGGDLHAMNLTYAPPGAKNDPNNTNRFWARDVTSIASRLQPGFGATTITAGRY